MNEVELKFLDIDVDFITKKIESLGAVKKYDTTIDSHTFLKEGFHRSDSSKKYLRVRKVDDTCELTYKDPTKNNSDMSVRDEIEINVSDFDSTVQIMSKLGFEVEPLFSKHRIHYELGNIHFELDTLSNLPTYLEIETQSEEAMKEICQKLNLDVSQGKKGTIFEILPHLNK